MFTSFPYVHACPRHEYILSEYKRTHANSILNSKHFVIFNKCFCCLLLFRNMFHYCFCLFEYFPMKWNEYRICWINKPPLIIIASNKQKNHLFCYFPIINSNVQNFIFRCAITYPNKTNFISDFFFIFFTEGQRRSVSGRSMVVGSLPVCCVRLSYIPNYSIHSHRVIAAPQSMHNHCKDIKFNVKKVNEKVNDWIQIIYNFIYLYYTMNSWERCKHNHTATKLLSKIFLCFSPEKFIPRGKKYILCSFSLFKCFFLKKNL